MKAFYKQHGATLWCGPVPPALSAIDDESIHTCVTSPPYWGLRDYGVAGQLGLEKTPQEYVEKLVAVFREVRRVLRDDGTLWLNLGDTYAGGGNGGGGSFAKDGIRCAEPGTDKNERPFWRRGGNCIPKGLKPKDLIGIPWRVAFALQADGWYLRQDIIWHKPNPMPESVTDRCTKAHEYIFLLSKSQKYYWNQEAMKEPAIGWNGSTFDGERDLTVRPNTGRGPRKRNDRFGGNKYVEGVKHSDGSVFTGSETRNKRSVWSVCTKPYRGAHFATFPPKLIEPCVLACAPTGGKVLDPFAGSGTTLAVAVSNGRQAEGCELNPEYCKLAVERIEAACPEMNLF